MTRAMRETNHIWKQHGISWVTCVWFCVLLLFSRKIPALFTEVIPMTYISYEAEKWANTLWLPGPMIFIRQLIRLGGYGGDCQYQQHRLKALGNAHINKKRTHWCLAYMPISGNISDPISYRANMPAYMPQNLDQNWFRELSVARLLPNQYLNPCCLIWIVHWEQFGIKISTEI